MAELQRLSAVIKRHYSYSFSSTPAQGHSEQLCSRIFNVVIFVLSRSSFHREQTAPVNVCKITTGKLVSALRIHSVTFVHAEMPLRVFGKAVRADKLVFHIKRRFVLAPGAFAISDQMSFLDKLRRKRDGIFVDFYAATRLRPGITDRVETNDQPDPRYTIEFADGCFHSRKPKRLPHTQKWQQYSPQRAVAQLGSALEWGSRGRGFKSRRPERFLPRIYTDEYRLSLAQKSYPCKSVFIYR